MNSKVRLLKAALHIFEHPDKDTHPMSGVCSALHEARGRGVGSKRALEDLLSQISESLGIDAYLHGWLLAKKHMTREQYQMLFDPLFIETDSKIKRREALRQKLKATRIAWLKSLIKEHEQCKPTKKSSRPSR